MDDRRFVRRMRRRRVALDLLLGGTLALLSLPLMIVLALASALVFRAWPIFTQERLGRGNHPFLFAKVRSLPKSTPKYANKYEIEDASTSRFGRFIRVTHLDELPQLFLVVVGKMSLVGPRPEMQQVADTFDPDFMVERAHLRPGCTGLWQVSVDANKLIGESPEFDRYYIVHQSVLLDLWILWRTVYQLRPGVAGVTLDEIPAWTNPSIARQDRHLGDSMLPPDAFEVAPEGVDLPR